MEIAVELSLYPLTAEFRPAVHDFLDRLNAHAGLKVVSNSLSTQVFGPYEEVLEVLRQELRTSFERAGAEGGKAAFVIKVFGPLGV